MATGPSLAKRQAQWRALVHVLVPIAFYLFGAGHTIHFVVAWCGATIGAVLLAWAANMHAFANAYRVDIASLRGGGESGATVAYVLASAERRKVTNLHTTIGWLAGLAGLAALFGTMTWSTMFVAIGVANAAFALLAWATRVRMRALGKQYQALMAERIAAMKAKTAALAAQPRPPDSPRLSEHPAFAH